MIYIVVICNYFICQLIKFHNFFRLRKKAPYSNSEIDRSHLQHNFLQAFNIQRKISRIRKNPILPTFLLYNL